MEMKIVCVIIKSYLRLHKSWRISSFHINKNHQPSISSCLWFVWHSLWFRAGLPYSKCLPSDPWVDTRNTSRSPLGRRQNCGDSSPWMAGHYAKHVRGVPPTVCSNTTSSWWNRKQSTSCHDVYPWWSFLCWNTHKNGCWSTRLLGRRDHCWH